MSIKINLKIFLFIILFYITKQIQLYALIMFFAFIHEIGHLLTGISLGLKPKSIKIMPLGISVEFKIPVSEYNEKILKGNELEIKKLVIALAGPVTNIIIILVACLMQKASEILIYANLLIAIFNLIPIYPLDGGRIIKSIIHIFKGKTKSIIYINKIANITMVFITAISSIAIVYYKNIAILFIVIYLWALVIVENKRYNVKMKIYKALEKETNINFQKEFVK